MYLNYLNVMTSTATTIVLIVDDIVALSYLVSKKRTS